MSAVLFRRIFSSLFLIFTLSATSVNPGIAAQSTSFKQAVVESTYGDGKLTDFYRKIRFEPVWTGTSRNDKARITALINALEQAPDHGLPAYDLAGLKNKLRRIGSDRERGEIEVELTRLFLKYVTAIQTGVLNPKRIDEGLVRRIPRRDAYKTLENFMLSTPAAYLRKLPPNTPEYARLRKQKVIYEDILANGGWGAKVPTGNKLEPGDKGPSVIALRNRLIAMGYMPRSSSAVYDGKLQKAVQAFQDDNGLFTDGIAGAGTLGEINKSVNDRIAAIIVALERERWMNMPRGERHIWVNLADFSAKIIDNGRVTFRTRSVVGANMEDRRSPEFSDVMEYMVINPSWFVPRSITVKEYLPILQEDPAGVSHLKLINAEGNIISREGIDFTMFNQDTFPFNMKQLPSTRNALGLVKFMFPNRYNIYLHDTPEKQLFGREKRAFSHGCIRLQQPFDFAYALLARQTNDPKGVFHSALNSGEETTIYLKKPVPVHLGYRTAITEEDGSIGFRRDVYGRDAKIFAALRALGVEIRPAGS